MPEGPGAPLYPVWVTHTGSTHVLHASPSVAKGRVYVAVTNPNARSPGGGVLCVDIKTGKRVWHAEPPLGDIRGAVSLHNDRVFALSGEGWIAAYDAPTGRPLWSRPLNPDDSKGRPLAINQTPPVPTRHGLLVSDWQTPQFLLSYDTGQQLARIDGNVGYYAAFPTVFEGVMYCARRGGAVALRLPSGEKVWSVEEKARSTSAVVVVESKVLYTASGAVKARDAGTGDILWQAAVPNAGYLNPVPIVWDDMVLVNGTDLVAVDLATGKRRWTVQCAREPDRFERSQRQAMGGSSTPIVAGDLAYVGHDDTSIRAVQRDGHVVWEHRLGTPIKTDPVVCGNLLLVHDYAGNLWCFAPAEVVHDPATNE
jgi:outer membrane protein assembly factor BamB